MPDAPRFGAGATETILHPVVLAAMILAVLLVLLLPRKYVIVPLLIFVFLTPMGQQIYAGGVHWLTFRIIILAGWVRMAFLRWRLGKKLYAGEFNKIDQAFVAFSLCQAVAVTLLFWRTDAAINQAAFLIETVGAYLLLRCLIRNRADIYRTVKVLAFLSVTLAAAMVYEQVTQTNLFGLLGGVKLIPDFREGHVRSHGAFQHSLMAGTFGATLVPLFFLLWKNGRARFAAAAGLIGSAVMTYTSQGSTPLLGYIAGFLGICFWPMRQQMRKVRWGIVSAILLLALVMKAPVWFVIAHIDLTGGSSGYHRAIIVDRFVRNIGDWWLLGVNDTSGYAYEAWDVQNQYVAVGENGGLAAFIFFLVMIVQACKRIGKGRRVVAGNSQEWLMWFLGAALFAHLVSFFGVNYFDQSKVSWFALLAIISAATLQLQPAVRRARVPVLSPSIEPPALTQGRLQNTDVVVGQRLLRTAE
jgi:hypothetical protein